MGKLNVSYNKTLKLSNALIMDLYPKDFEFIDKKVEIMQNYIKIKKKKPVGPIIQHTYFEKNDSGEVNVKVNIIIQTDSLIENTEEPYKSEPIIYVKNCLYVRFTGNEEQLNFAYDKLNLTAFEEDIKLKGDSYTVFLKQEPDYVIADVFMEKKDE